MYYLIPIPIILLAAIVYIVTSFFQMKAFAKVSKIVIIVFVIVFIITFLNYYDINILKRIRDFIEPIISKIVYNFKYLFS